MPYNGSGTFSILNTFVAGTTILASSMNSNLTDIATGLSTAVLKNGTQTLTANIPFAGFGITNMGSLGAATIATVASAATTNVLGASSLFVTVSGTTTITSLGTGTLQFKIVRFSGALILTHNATSLILPSGANITTASGDCMVVISDSSSNARVVSYQKADGTAIVGAATWTGQSNAEVTVASASTTDILGAASAFVAISGTTTITSFGTGTNRVRFVRFTGALTLTHNATSLILPTGANMTVAAGDCMVVISDGSSNARVYAYQNSLGVQLAQLAIVAGDIIYGTGTGTVGRLPKGTDTNVLTQASGLPSWAAPAATYTPPTSSSLPLGTVAMMSPQGSSPTNNNTIAGSSLKTAVANSSGVVSVAGATTQSGTWTNISTATVSSGAFGLFVRTA